MNYAIAVKSFIVNDGKLLIVRRAMDDVQKPGIWELPGGRLEGGEDPFIGLKRETKEETGIDIDVEQPLNIQHFTRDDGQTITMLIFLCKVINSDVKLSKEHTDHKWIDIDKSKEKLVDFFHGEVDIYKKLMIGK